MSKYKVNLTEKQVFYLDVLFVMSYVCWFGYLICTYEYVAPPVVEPTHDYFELEKAWLGKSPETVKDLEPDWMFGFVFLIISILFTYVESRR